MFDIGDTVIDNITGKVARIMERVFDDPFMNKAESAIYYHLDNSIPVSPNYPDSWRHDGEISRYVQG